MCKTDFYIHKENTFLKMISEYLSALILGGILGMVGQSLRVIVGMKKYYERVQEDFQQGKKSTEKVDWTFLSISLLIGFVAGAFGIILKIDYESASTMVMNKDFMISIIAIGYMGVDFIEGMMKKLSNNFANSNPTNTANQGGNQVVVQPNTPPANDGSFGAGGNADLPVADVPNGGYRIPTDIPDTYPG